MKKSLLAIGLSFCMVFSSAGMALADETVFPEDHSSGEIAEESVIANESGIKHNDSSIKSSENEVIEDIQMPDEQLEQEVSEEAEDLYQEESESKNRVLTDSEIFKFYVYEGEVSITGLKDKSATEIVVPDTLDGYPVTSIDIRVFSECSSLTSVSIPDSVTSIGEEAFSECSSLTNITLPHSVTNIGGYAFSGCSNLTCIIIPEGVTSIGGGVFSGCSSLTDITIPDSVTNIGESAFFGCSSLTDIIIPNSVTDIGKWAFENCSSLTSITIPDSMTSIGWRAFYGCSSLTSITIPESVMSISIGGLAFAGCNSLTSITIPEGVMSIGSGVFSGCSSLESITVSEDNLIFDSRNNCNAIIEKKTNSIISGCKNTIIPDSVTNIGESAFFGCSSLTDIIIPNSVTNIGKWAFENCSSLTDIIIPNSVTDIGESAFFGCSSLMDIKIPEGVTSIRDNTFSGCSSLASVTVPDSVISCGNNAFPENCVIICSEKTFDFWNRKHNGRCFSSTDNVTGNAGRNVIYSIDPLTCEMILSGSGPFYSDFKCPYPRCIRKVTIMENINSINGNAFSDCVSLESVTIPDSVTSIGGGAFSDCTSLENVIIPNSVTSIGGWTFRDCKSLVSIAIPDSVREIGDASFEGCISLTGITIPDSVTIIGNFAFYKCISLTSITIPESVDWIGDSAFEECTGMTSLEIKNGSAYYGTGAFSDCSSLTSITIPEGMQKVYSSTFSGSNITDIHMPSIKAWLDFPIHRFGSSTHHLFIDGTELTEIIIPKGVTSIWNDTFFGCINLASIAVPDSVARIYSKAFAQCEALQKCYFYGTDVDISIDAFDHCDNITLYCPPGSNIKEFAERMGIPCITNVIPTAPRIGTITSSNSGCTLSWSKSDNAQGYYVYRKAGTGAFRLVNTIAGGSTVKWTDSGAKTNGMKYTYYVEAYNTVDGTTYTSAPSDEKAVCFLTQPAITSVMPTASGMQVAWKKNSKAGGYNIYRKTGSGKVALVNTVTKASTVKWTDTGAKTNGAKYTYYVTAFKKIDNVKYESAKSPAVASYFLTAPAINSVKNTAAKKMTVKWSKNKKASGYEIKYVTGSTKKTVTVTNKSTVRKVIGSLKKGKTYKVSMRSYKTVSGKKYYSAWSAAKSVKITK